MARVGDVVQADGSRPYQLLLEIGSGGMARVFLARTIGVGGFHRFVAVKVCREDLAQEPSFRAMFLDEARLAAMIHHPNVVPTLDVGAGKQLFLVMDYVEGFAASKLRSRVEQTETALPLDIALRVVLDALAGLHAAHEATSPAGENLAIVHRDISPHNLLVGFDGVTRVLDFGVASALSRSTTTKNGQVKGKLAYMTPEYLYNRAVGRFTDVYAMGVVAWELLSGRSLFDQPTEGQVLAAVMRGDISHLCEARTDISRELGDVIQRATARSQAHRYQTAQAFADALEGVSPPVASHRQVRDYLLAEYADQVRALRSSVRDASHDQDSGSVGRDKERARFWMWGEKRGLVLSGLVIGVATLGLSATLLGSKEQERARQDGFVEQARPGSQPVERPMAPVDAGGADVTHDAATQDAGVDARLAPTSRKAVKKPRRRLHSRERARRATNKWLPDDI